MGAGWMAYPPTICSLAPALLQLVFCTPELVGPTPTTMWSGTGVASGGREGGPGPAASQDSR